MPVNEVKKTTQACLLHTSLPASSNTVKHSHQPPPTCVNNRNTLPSPAPQQHYLPSVPKALLHPSPPPPHHATPQPPACNTAHPAMRLRPSGRECTVSKVGGAAGVVSEAEDNVARGCTHTHSLPCMCVLLHFVYTHTLPCMCALLHSAYNLTYLTH